MIQVIHEEDVCRPSRWRSARECRGVYNVTGPGESPALRGAARARGASRSRSHFMVRPVVKRLFRRAPLQLPARGGGLRDLCAVDGSGFVRDTGWTPLRPIRDTLRSVLGGRRPPAPPPFRARTCGSSWSRPPTCPAWPACSTGSLPPAPRSSPRRSPPGSCSARCRRSAPG